jgi:hypothetical protein
VGKLIVGLMRMLPLCAVLLVLPAIAAAQSTSLAFTVDSTLGWQTTSMMITTGQELSFSASGSWTVDYRFFPEVGPDGYPPEVDSTIFQGCKLDPQLPYAKLLARVGDDPSFWAIGSGGTFTANRDGALAFRIHDGDGCLLDNAGTVQVTVASTQAKAIFAGIYGGGREDLDDDPNNEVPPPLVDSQIVDYVNTLPACQPDGCNPHSLDDLTAIANSDRGITALGFYMTSISSHRVTLNLPGNSETVKNDIDTHYNEGDRIYLTGHSAGGGDVQNLLEKLNTLGIPVEFSGHIDSYEGESGDDDNSITSNVKIAKGYYQTQSFIQGEANLKAVDPQKTHVENILITDPQGPDKPWQIRLIVIDFNASHRNMDNDNRVWGDILTEIIGIEFPKQASATSPSEEFNIDLGYRSIADFITIFSGPGTAQEKRLAREKLARLQLGPEDFELLLHYYHSTNDEIVRVHLQSVISKIDSASFIAKIALEAADIDDEALFISLVYSLRKASTREAKEALLRLIGNNSIRFPRQSVNAIHTALFDTMNSSDVLWLLNFVAQNRLSDEQIYVITRLYRKYQSSDNVLVLLENLESIAKSLDLINLIRLYKQQIENNSRLK